MANANSSGGVYARLPSPARMKPVNGQERKKELEQEVAKLHKILEHEEKVNKVLQSAMDENGGPLPHIPSFLPPKMKELLMELAVVDAEIGHLESQVSNLQRGLTPQREAHQDTKARESQIGKLSSLATPPRHPTPRPQGSHQRRAPETRCMYFINQAIKGDDLPGLPLSLGFTRNKEAEETLERALVSKKSGVFERQRPASFSAQKLPPPRPPRPSKALEHDSEISFNMLLSPTPSTSTPVEESQKLQPNRLSESIMKCLICIFVRLIRTTKTTELEKSGVVSRSSHLTPLNSKSFRSEGSSISKSGILIQKDSGQQDPYGIFNSEDSIQRDIGPYKNYVIFTSSSLDAKSVSSCVSLLRKLRVMVNNLNNVDLRFLTYQQKLAFWINMYNACIMHGFLQHGIPTTPEKMLALMNKAVLDIGGNKLNPLAIEHFILRQQPSKIKENYWKGEKNNKEDIARSIYGLEHPEPNVAFALSCGIKSSPAVRIYTADGVSSELEKAKLEYLQASIVVKSIKRLLLPKLLLGFGREMESLVEWVCEQLPTSGSLRKSMVECFRGQNSGKIGDVVEIMPYEFEFQYLLAM